MIKVTVSVLYHDQSNGYGLHLPAYWQATAIIIMMLAAKPEAGHGFSRSHPLMPL
jgi:hypothetical protein